MEQPDRALNLQALLRTICLRRTEKLLSVQKPRFEQKAVILTPVERSLHDDILKTCAYNMDDATSSKAGKIKRYSILFTAIMKLRRACNHGTFLDHAPNSSSVATPSTETELDCDSCGGDDEVKLGLADNAGVCSDCGRCLNPAAKLSNTNENLLTAETFGLQTQPVAQQAHSTKLQTIVKTIHSLGLESKRLVLLPTRTAFDPRADDDFQQPRFLVLDTNA